MMFRDLTDLQAYVNRLVRLGLGHCRPMLDRRGCACGQGPAPLGDPGDGERVSADGSTVYFSVRRMEEATPNYRQQFDDESA